MRKSPIKDIVLAITYQCNARCQFCHIWQNDDKFSTKPLDYSNLPQNIKHVNISGGEPFLREDLPEIVKIVKLRSHKAKIIISTNGFLPGTIKKQVQKIIKFKRDIGIAVSIDAFNSEHDKLRGFEGGFKLALETVRLLKELGIKDIKIAFTLGDKNISQLRRIYRLSREMKTEFSLALYHNSAHYFKTTENSINNTEQMINEVNWLIRQELKSANPKRWLRAYFAHGIIEVIKTGKRILPDYSGINSLFIDPCGDIYPSDVWNLKLGKIQKITSWSDFSRKANQISSSQQAPVNWMVCTARQAIRKHWPKAGWWILKEKIKYYPKKTKQKTVKSPAL